MVKLSGVIFLLLAVMAADVSRAIVFRNITQRPTAVPPTTTAALPTRAPSTPRPTANQSDPNATIAPTTAPRSITLTVPTLPPPLGTLVASAGNGSQISASILSGYRKAGGDDAVVVSTFGPPATVTAIIGQEPFAVNQTTGELIEANLAIEYIWDCDALQAQAISGTLFNVSSVNETLSLQDCGWSNTTAQAVFQGTKVICNETTAKIELGFQMGLRLTSPLWFELTPNYTGVVLPPGKIRLISAPLERRTFEVVLDYPDSSTATPAPFIPPAGSWSAVEGLLSLAALASALGRRPIGVFWAYRARVALLSALHYAYRATNETEWDNFTLTSHSWWFEHPASISLGSGPIATDAGICFSGAFIVAGCVAMHGMATVFVALCDAPPSEDLPEDLAQLLYQPETAPDDDPAAQAVVEVARSAGYLAAAVKFRFPGLSIIPWALLALGMLQSSVTVLFIGINDAEDIASVTNTSDKLFHSSTSDATRAEYANATLIFSYVLDSTSLKPQLSWSALALFTVLCGVVGLLKYTTLSFRATFDAPPDVEAFKEETAGDGIPLQDAPSVPQTTEPTGAPPQTAAPPAQPVRTPQQEAIYVRVIAMYRHYAPEKIHMADKMMSKFEGVEADLIEQLIQKYGPEPPPLEVAAPSANPAQSNAAEGAVVAESPEEALAAAEKVLEECREAYNTAKAQPSLADLWAPYRVHFSWPNYWRDTVIVRDESDVEDTHDHSMEGADRFVDTDPPPREAIVELLDQLFDKHRYLATSLGPRRRHHTLLHLQQHGEDDISSSGASTDIADPAEKPYIEVPAPGFVQRYGLLFDCLNANAPWFVAVEFGLCGLVAVATALSTGANSNARSPVFYPDSVVAVALFGFGAASAALQYFFVKLNAPIDFYSGTVNAGATALTGALILGQIAMGDPGFPTDAMGRIPRQAQEPSRALATAAVWLALVSIAAVVVSGGSRLILATGDIAVWLATRKREEELEVHREALLEAQARVDDIVSSQHAALQAADDEVHELEYSAEREAEELRYRKQLRQQEILRQLSLQGVRGLISHRAENGELSPEEIAKRDKLRARLES